MVTLNAYDVETKGYDPDKQYILTKGQKTVEFIPCENGVLISDRYSTYSFVDIDELEAVVGYVKRVLGIRGHHSVSLIPESELKQVDDVKDELKEDDSE